MSEKPKRKGNPRRMMLMQVISLITIVMIALVAGMRLLSPTGTQIVYVAPDDNGIDNIWIADVTNPDNPRQLTNFDTPISPFTNLQVMEAINTAIFSTGEFFPEEFWRLNLDTGNTSRIFTCDNEVLNCPSITISPDGNWLAYFDRVVIDESGKTISAYIHNLENDETITLYTVEGAGDDVPFPYLDWADNQIVYQPDLVNEPFTFEFYDVYTEEVIQTIVMNELQAEFSKDGSFYSASSAFSDNPITFYSTDATAESVEALAEFDEERLVSGLMDWHPDNEQVLISHGTLWDTDNHYNELSLYHAMSGEKNILFSNDDGIVYSYAVFNADGSQLLYFTRNSITNEFSPFIVLDMETGEETTLPLSGRNPLWLNSEA